MYKKWLPTWYSSSIHNINYDLLLSKGIKIIFSDLDNTIAPYNVEKPTQKEKDLINKLKKKNFKIIIISNNNIKRVDLFTKDLEVDSIANCKKPLTSKIKKYLELNNIKLDECVVIGDQIATDIWVANNLKVKSILVEPVQKRESIQSYLNRKLDKSIRKRLVKKELLNSIERSE